MVAPNPGVTFERFQAICVSKCEPTRVSILADEIRVRILHRDILGQEPVCLYALPEQEAARELARFAAEVRRIPNMEGYFDRQHILNMQAHLSEAQHGFTTLQSSGVLEVVSLPTFPDEVMGFHIYTVFDPADESAQGKLIGYAVYSLEKGRAPFGQAEAVRMAFDIFPDYRAGRYRTVEFTSHEIYNVSRRILLRYKPRRFLADARSQIIAARTSEPFTRVVYYLKRGYYPPDQKPLADACLVRLAQGKRLGRKSVTMLIRKARATFWVFPVSSG